MAGLSDKSPYPFGIWTLDVDRELVFADDVVSDYFGISVDQGRSGLPLKKLMNAVKADDTNRIYDAIRNSSKPGSAFREMFELTSQHFGSRVVEMLGRIDERGYDAPRRMIGVMRDVYAGAILEFAARSRVMRLLEQARSRSIQFEVIYILEVVLMDLKDGILNSATRLLS